MSQLQYFQLSTIVELHKKNQETQKFCPLALIFHLAPYLIFIAVLKSTYPERMVLVTQYKQYFSRIRTTTLVENHMVILVLNSKINKAINNAT